MAEDPDEIREAIDRTRAQMAETIQALGEKADVKARLAEKVSSARTRMAEAGHRVEQAVPEPARPAATALVEKTGSLTGEGVATVRRNPKIAVLVASALALMLMVRTRRRRTLRWVASPRMA